MKSNSQGVSTELTGGAGFTFEDGCLAIYLCALLGEGPCRGLPNRTVVRVASQRASAGEPMDDIIVEAESPNSERAKLSLQVKKALTVSSAESNQDFRSIILGAYATITKPEFRADIDQVGAITGSIRDDSKRAVETVCTWAKSQDTSDTFLGKFSPGVSNNEHRKFHNAVRDILRDSIPANRLDTEVHRLLKHFVLMEFDLLHDGATDESNAVALLRYCLKPIDATRSADLWSCLRVIAREAAGQGAAFSRPNLIPRLHGSFRLVGAISLRKSLDLLFQEAQLGLKDIAVDVIGSVIPRTKVIEETRDKLKQHSFVQIIGIPGAGKSAVLRLLCDEFFKAGTGLFLKSDKLSYSSWSAYAMAIGLDAVSLESLLLEITLCGTPILAIDGLDRISPESRGIVRDILNTILGNPVLKSAWSIAATVRSGGIEDIRTWLPSNLFDESQPAMVEVKAFDDEESRALADALPALRALLFSENERVREISRRPFFAAVIGKSFGNTQGSPVEANSEIQLIDAWWVRGGYNANSNRILYRTEALRRLAAYGSATLGRGISLEGTIDLGAITELKADGILKDGAPGSVRFSHDIFFEWAYLHVLMGRESEWPDEIRRVGEPPVLGRVVELLSQKALASSPASWGNSLTALETSDLRPQWARAWLLGPIGHSEFLDKATPFTDALFYEGSDRVRRLAVWFQAEKTRPNPAILDGSSGKGLSLSEAVRLADLYAWPSDIRSWQRGCQWFIDNIGRCPIDVIPEIVAVFEVWQNALADHPNAISRQIMVLVHSWLIDIEDLIHAEDYRRSGEGKWHTLPEGGMKELEQRLRHLFVRSVRTLPNEVKDYLSRVADRPRLRKECFKDVLTFSPILAEKIGPVLVSFLLAELKQELPNDVAKRPMPRGMFNQGPSIHDRLELALNPNTHAFFPASPLWQPFPALFQSSPEDGLYAVRELSNHAITAWRQFCANDWERPSTPIPLVMDFPWGLQSFWGSHKTYTWFRGNGGPGVLASALMALEKWAFSEIEKGVDADGLIRKILTGHESCAVLGIAVAIALHTKRVSNTTLPFISSQALWWWDIARMGYDRTASSMLLSFHETQDHIAALREQNSWEVRKSEIRDLAMRFVICNDETLAKAAQSVIQDFPKNIHFATEEEKKNSDDTDSVLRQALIWAEWGKPENYTARRFEGNGQVLIELNNPTAQDPDVVASRERVQTLNQQLGLSLWADESFSGSQISARMSLIQALETAHLLEGPELFTQPVGMLSFSDQAVAAVAAVAMKFFSSIPEAERQWAVDVIFRVTELPEPMDEEFYSMSENPYHVGLHALRGLVFMIRGKIRVLEAQQALIRLTAHPRESISKNAVSAILGLWDVDKRFSWIGLNLAINLSTGYWNGNPDESGQNDLENNAKAVEAALAKMVSGDNFDFKLSRIPPAWEFAQARPIRGPFNEEQPAGAPHWRSPDTHFDHRYLSSLLRSIPFKEILQEHSMASQFLIFCNTMTEWTVERISPTWDTRGQNRRDRETNIFEWKMDLSRFLGQVAIHLEPAQVRTVFLDVIASLDDDDYFDMLSPFLDMLGCGIMDDAVFPENAIAIMGDCLPRILASDDWSMLRRRSSRHLDEDLSKIVSSLFFVQVGESKAPNSARFANGDWSEVGKILPLVDSVVMSFGDIPRVASLFLTLCERAGANYPMEKFLDHMHGLFKLQSSTPVGWRETYLPNRIASLIQNFATRTQPLPLEKAQSMLRLLDRLVDMGDRRATALQTSELFKNTRADSARELTSSTL